MAEPRVPEALHSVGSGPGILKETWKAQTCTVVSVAAGVEGVIENDVSGDDSVFFNSPGVAVLKWDPTSGAVHIEWQGWADSTEFALLLEAGLRALREYHGSRWLADCRNMKTIEQSDQEWLDRSWFPRMLAAGLQRMAVLMPKSALAKMNVEDILGKVPGTKLQVAYFATVNEARQWLTRPSTNPPIGQEATSTT
jgi:hypothetical protein